MQRKTLHKQYKKLGISAVIRIGFNRIDFIKFTNES